MAIAEMKKIHLVGHQHIENRVTQLLHHLGVTQIIDIREENEELRPESSGEEKKLEERLAQINRILAFLSQYEKSSFVKGLWDSFFPAKAYFAKEEARHILRSFSELEAYHDFKALDEKIELIKIKRGELEEEKKNLLGYFRFPLAKKDLAPTKETGIIWGVIPKKSFLKIGPVLNKKFKKIWVKTFQAAGKNLFLIVVFLKDRHEDISEFLRSSNFQFGNFSRSQVGTPQERLEEIAREKESLGLEEEKINKDIGRLLSQKAKLLLLHDTISSRLEQRYISRSFSQTRATFILEGWVKESELKILKEKLIKIFPELEIVVSSPLADAQPPIAFQNRSWIKPFEFITRLYGAPAYRSFDPTPFLMPFFALFFSLCISDAGYGLILLLLGWWLLKKVKLERGQKIIFRVLLLSGFLAIIVGVITGSIFCLDFEQLPLWLGFLKGFRNKLMIFDPLENIMLFLGICLGLGLVQIYFGILLKVILQLKRKRIIEALFQELPWLFLISGLILWAAVSMGGLKDSLLPLAKISTSGGAVILFLFAGRGTKNIFLRLGKGLFTLYGTVGMLGDILSYTRLLALSLATVVIGLAVNVIAALFSRVPFIGILLGLAVVIFGHGFNLFINSLSGFAHTLRLQFVEFFTKFYEGGGEFFQPFQMENKFTRVE